MLKRLTALSFILLTFAACGDDKNPFRVDGGGDDIDGGDIDAGPDAEPAVTTHTATVSILDVRVRTTTGAVDGALGSGGQVVASFRPIAGDVPGVVDAVGQIYDDRDSVGQGCAAFVWDLALGQIPPTAEDHGTVTITGSTANIPPCTFVSDEYLCLGVNGAGAATSTLTANPVVTTTAADANFAAITVVGATYSAADVGRYVNISGATNFRNNGTFPIIAFNAAPAPTLVYVNPPASTQADLTGVTFQVIAGAGPAPGVPASPEFLADADLVTVALDAPAGDEFVDFTATAVNAGDNFSLTTAANTTIVNIPVDGSEFTLACNSNVVTVTSGGFVADSPGADQVTLAATGIGTPNTRVGAEVTITNATSAGNNGTYTITAVGSGTITYTNANGVSEGFAADPVTSAVVNDCGSAGLTAVNIDFSNATLTNFISAGTGTGQIVEQAGSDCQIQLADAFSVGLGGARVTIAGSTTAGNDGTFLITDSTTDMIEFANAGCNTESVAAAGTYEVFDDISGATTEFLMPDPLTSHATKIGHIQCAALAVGSVTVDAGASAAIMSVDPARIRTVMVRGGLAQEVATNPSNIIVGHAIVGFTDTP